MILEIMQPDYLVRSAKAIEEILGDQLAAAASGGDPELNQLLSQAGVDTGDLKLALERTVEAVALLKGPAEDEAVILPRDASSSQLQSLLQRYFLEHHLVRRPAVAGVGEIVHPISDLSLDPSVASPAPKRLFAAMSQTDARWIACLAASVYRNFKRRRAFPDRPANPNIIANDARIYLLADWGTGIARANKIADRIKIMLTQSKREQHVIHLGDVYYSGWPEEYDEHFLAHCPVQPGEENLYGSWSLNGNHDMFSGGHGYFDHLLKDERFRR